MRVIFTLCLLLVSSICFSQVNDRIILSEYNSENSISSCRCNFQPCGLVKGYIKANDSTKKKSNENTNVTTVGTRCYATCTNCEPLFVIDGIPVENKLITDLDPNTIERITVLKNAAATALYGSEGRNGVIIITTNGLIIRKFIIKDFLDGSRIAGATVLFSSAADKNDKLQIVANDSGVVTTNMLKRSAKYQMTVSAVGHKTVEELFENRYSTVTKEILLAREIMTCPEVVVTCFDCVRTIRCGYRITVTRTREVIEAKQQAESFIVFPNPISKGGVLNIKFKTTDNEKKTIRVLSSDGRILSAIPVNADKAVNNFQLQTDGRWSAGIYFVQLVYENGKIAASERIVVQ